MSISIPLDDEHYLRRECNFCKKEFKIEIDEEDLKKQTEMLMQNYLDEDNHESKEEDDEIRTQVYYCPNCGQEAEMKTFWTIPQIEYIQTHVKNYVNNIINEKLIKEMGKMSRRSSGLISFKGEEIPYIQPFIAPEENDMEKYRLKCCNKEIKVEKLKGTIYCFYCGFKHEV